MKKFIILLFIAASSFGADFILYGTGATNVVPAVLEVGRQAAVTITNSLPADEMYLMWGRNGDGAGAPVAINKTEAWWVGPDTVASNGAFSVYGQNLDLGNATNFLYVMPDAVWLTNATANPYKSDFVAVGLTNGTKTIYAHNGKGREYGWSDSLTLTVETGAQWDDDTNTWFNVTSNAWGADSSGVADSMAAIVAAMDAADGNWGTVYFPAGTYSIDGQIEGNYSKIRMKGAGTMTNSILQQLDNDSLGGSGNAIFDVGLSYCVMEDLTIQNIDTAYVNKMLELKGSYYSRFERIRLSQRYPEVQLSTLDVNKAPEQNFADSLMDSGAGASDHLTFKDCEFIVRNSIVFLNAHNNIFFDGCDFYGIDMVNTLLNIRGAVGVSITDCTAQNWDTSNTNHYNWGNGRFVYSFPRGDDAKSPRHWYYGGNETIDYTQPETAAYQNTGEDFMFERCQIVFIDNPIDVDGLNIIFSNLPSYGNDRITTKGHYNQEIAYVGYTLSVIGGKGFGQSRIITDVNSVTETITIDEAWNVNPDTDSLLAVSLAANSIVAYNNIFDGIERAGGLDYTAESGVQAYGGCVNLVADSNYSTDQESCFYVYSNTRALASRSDNQPTPNLFNLYQNNTASNDYHLTRVMVAVPSDYEGFDTQEYTAMSGNVFRNNTATNIAGTAINLEYEGDLNYPFHSLCVYDGNNIYDFDEAMKYYNKQNGSSSDSAPVEIENQVFTGNTTNGVPWTP